jgi:hypothetical protein
VDQVSTSRKTPHPGDRRRYPRQKVASIIYVQLDSKNGGIIRDLGIGGLSLQAADKLLGKEDLTVRFRLPGTGHSVQVVGGIAWLAQTEKEAGIYFKDLSRAAEEEIMRWVVKRKQAEQPPAPSLSPTLSVPQVDSVAVAPPAPRAIFSRGPQSWAAQPALYAPKAVSAIRPVPKVEHKEVVEAVPKRQWVLPTSLSPLRKEDQFSPARIAAQMKELRHLGKILLITAGGLLGLLILILLGAYFPTSHGSASLQQTSAASAESTSDTTHPTPPRVPPEIRKTHRTAWEIFVGALVPGKNDDTKKFLSPDEATVEVWVSKHSGYYYCTGAIEYGTTQPGDMMQQGEALQSGYQPKLGDFCY